MPSFLGVCFILFLILNSKGLATDNSTFIKFDHTSAFETKLYRSKYKIETLKKAKFIHFNKDDLVKHWPEHIPVTVGITNKQAFYVSYLPLMIPVIHEITIEK